MPFTPAHVVAVLPLRRYGLFSLTGLVIGSMVPDYEYFLRMTLYGHYGHTLAGIFFFDLPLGLLLYIAYHAVVHRQLIAHLPLYFYTRFACAEGFGWKRYLAAHFPAVLLSLAAGILTHFIWDGFTHDEEYYFARRMRFLLYRFDVLGHAVPLHAILQLLSSVAGLLLLYLYIRRLPVSPAVRRLSAGAVGAFWAAVFAVSTAAGTIRWLAGMPAEKLFGQAVVVSISAFHIGLLAVCAWLQVRRRKALDAG